VDNISSVFAFDWSVPDKNVIEHTFAHLDSALAITDGSTEHRRGWHTWRRQQAAQTNRPEVEQMH
jgi:hypothetical protein